VVKKDLIWPTDISFEASFPALLIPCLSVSVREVMGKSISAVGGLQIVRGRRDHVAMKGGYK